MTGTCQSLFGGFLGQQPCRHHHRWIAGIGAAGDRGDDDRTMTDLRECPLF